MPWLWDTPARWQSTEPDPREPSRDGRLVNDHVLVDHEQQGTPQLLLYEPADISVVLGLGGVAGRDVHLVATGQDRVPVLRRRGGGGTVVLAPGQVVIALAVEVAHPFQNRAYARQINACLIRGLANLGVHEVRDAGICDLALGDRKILGSSIYRRRRILFFQASLLVNSDLSLLGRYLTYPAKVPAYRAGRSHADFCTSLRLAGHRVSCAQVVQALATALRELVAQPDLGLTPASEPASE